MNTLNQISYVLIGMLAAALILAVVARRMTRDRARMRRRVVEQPNSHFTSPLARNNENRDRWRDIALDRLHELNRTEVLHLLEKVDASGVDALRQNERVFLDRMVELAGPKPARDPGPPPSTDLRHSPA
jgi:hypothetical protein